MTAKRIFYITANELAVFYCQKGVVNALARYDATVEGVSEFAQYLAQQPGDPSALLVDVIEEEYRMETIPHVRGGDRNHLLERKLNKLFRRTPFFSAQVQGREKSERRDDQLMCAALTNPDMVELWLAEVRTCKVPLSGIYSVATVTEQLLKKLHIKHDNALVLSLQHDNLLRQSFFHQYRLKISRLSLLSQTDVESCVANVKNEVERNQRYINRLQLLPFNEPMDVCLLSSNERLASYQEAFMDSKLLRHHIIDINEAAQKIGLKMQLQEGQCEWLYAYLASLTTPSVNYAPKEERHYFKMFQMRKGLVAGSVILALSGMLYSAASVLDAWKIREQAEDTAVKVAHMEQRHARAVAALPAVKFSPKVMRSAVEVNRQLSANNTHPQVMMSLLGKELSRFSNIHLDEIRWQAVKPDAQLLDDENIIMDDEGNVIEQALEDSRLLQVMVIKARLEPQIKNYQSAFNQIEDFISILDRNQHFYKVETVSLPLNVDPASTLMGESGLTLKNPTAFFEIKVVMPVDSDEA